MNELLFAPSISLVFLNFSGWNFVSGADDCRILRVFQSGFRSQKQPAFSIKIVLCALASEESLMQRLPKARPSKSAFCFIFILASTSAT